MSIPSCPYGCAVCEVEVDPDTGLVEVVRYTTVDDVGRAVTPLILHGQTHGGIAAGVGQALWELCHYDREGGTTPALGVVVNAIVDTLADFGVEHVEMPAAPERVWRAIQAATARR